LKSLKLPLKDRAVLKNFKAGELVFVDGVIYTARDRVHDLISKGRGKWPFELKNNAIFYCGPTPKPKGRNFGSCGPTTSSRMDSYTPALYKKGLAATIGKGPRSPEVIESIKKYGGVYLVAYGGCGALYAETVREAEPAGFKDLGPQAVYKITVSGFPAVVGIDSRGGNVFKR
jgi:fumarate hydratase subunit beta